jgi:hypothetical protein
MRVRVTLAPDHSHICVSVADAPSVGVSVDSRCAMDRVVRFVREIVHDFLDGIVDVAVEFGPTAPVAAVGTKAQSGVFICQSGNVTTDSVFAEGFHDVQTALASLRGKGAVHHSHDTSSAEWCRVMKEMGTVVTIVSDTALRTHARACREHGDTIDVTLLQWLVAVTLAKSGIVQLHVIALGDNVDATAVDGVSLPPSLLDKASELLGDRVPLEFSTLSGVFAALLDPQCCCKVKNADDFGATYLVIPFERATRPGQTIRVGCFSCPLCCTVSTSLQSLPQLPPEIDQDLHLNFKCSVGLAPCGGCTSSADLPDDIDPMCVYSVCGHTSCCVHCAVTWVDGVAATAPPQPASGDGRQRNLLDQANVLCEAIARAGGSPAVCEKEGVELVVPAQVGDEKCKVSIVVRSIVAKFADGRVVGDELRMPDPPVDSTFPSSVRRVLRPVSHHVVSVKRLGVEVSDNQKEFASPVEVTVTHLVLPLESREVYPVYGTSSGDKVAGTVLEKYRVTDFSSGRTTVLLSEPCEWLTLCVVREHYTPSPETPLTLHGPHGVVVVLVVMGVDTKLTNKMILVAR